jgi:predicted nucleic acid-binding protein
LKLLFDAGSIAEMLKKRRGDAVDVLAGDSTLDLAVYELGNVVWKESRRRGGTEEETQTTASYVEQVLGVMELYRIQIGDVKEIERYALKQNLSFYDASYFAAAKKGGKTLVTEDEQLRQAAKEAKVLCLNVNEILV